MRSKLMQKTYGPFEFLKATTKTVAIDDKGVRNSLYIAPVVIEVKCIQINFHGRLLFVKGLEVSVNKWNST